MAKRLNKLPLSQISGYEAISLQISKYLAHPLPILKVTAHRTENQHYDTQAWGSFIYLFKVYCGSWSVSFCKFDV